MTTSFRKPFTVIERNLGTWNEGVYLPDDDAGTKKTIMATIQEVSAGERNAIEANPWGRREARYIKIYTDTRLKPPRQAREPGDIPYPGDLVLFDGGTYLVFGEANFTMLQRSRATPVSHWRYYACEMIEYALMDGAP